PLTARADVAAVQLDQVAHERQTDAEPALRSAQRARVLDEEVEDSPQHVGLDAEAVVDYFHGYVLALLLDRKRDRSALFGVLSRVGEQVLEDLREPDRIALHPDRLVRHAATEVMTLAL